MPESTRQPVLHLIVSEAKPAADLEPFIKNCQEIGWDIYVIATPAALKVINKGALAQLTGHAVREDKQTKPLYPLPSANALAVAPANFDIINKWAYGNNDNLALRLLNEATGLGLPIVVVPTPDPALSRHPVLIESLARLRRWGVNVVFNPAVYALPGGDSANADPFPWQAAERVIAEWTRFARLPAPNLAAS
ncbi:MAG TPA: flavoprotein [Micromonosporaceae bacterium]|nr:flavoprotein [Micromonosporaceae bacterium]